MHDKHVDLEKLSPPCCMTTPDAQLLCRLAFYKWKMRRRKSCLTQEQLVKAYEGPNFELSDRYGEVCCCCTCWLSALCSCLGA